MCYNGGMLRNDQPLFLPPGSVRSILALLLVVGFLVGLVPEDITILVLGFYFITREGVNESTKEAPEFVSLVEEDEAV